MSGWMETILVASRDAGILALVIGLTIKLSGRRMPARFCHAAWLLVAVRLLMPVLPTSPFSWQHVLSANESPPPNAVSEIKTIPPVAENEITQPNISSPVYPTFEQEEPALMSSETPQPTVSPSASMNPWDIAAGVWICGVIGLLSLGTGAALRFRRRALRLTKSHPKAGDLEIALGKIGEEFGWKRLPRLQITEAVDSPALFGLIRPRILMPPALLDDLSDFDLRLVLLHELGHWRRRDIAVNFALALAQAIHWFNPLVWWAFHRARLESERATDDWVLQRTGAEHSSDYGEMLLRLLAKRAKPRAAFSGMVSVVENPSDLRQRMTAIGRFTGKRHILAAVMSFALLIGMAAVGLTKPPIPGKETVAVDINTPEMSDELFTCSVVSADGLPVEGAEIYANMSGIFNVDPTDTLMIEGKTNSEGEFRSPLPETITATKDVLYEIFAHHSEYGVAAVGGINRSGVPSKILKLSKGFPLRFRVSDEEGKPVANLDLRVAAASIPNTKFEDTEFWGDVPELPRGLWSGITDAEGRCVIEGLPGGRYYLDHSNSKYAQFPGRHDFRFHHIAEKEAPEVELKVEVSASVSGKVTFPDGSPAVGVKVKILEHYHYAQGGCSAETITDSAGNYILERLLPALFDVKVKPDNQDGNTWAYEIKPVELEKAENRKDVDFTLDAGGLVKGRVTLSDTGAPVPDYWVGISMEETPSPLHNEGTRTDKDGSYSYRVSAGEKKVYPGASGPEGYTTWNSDKSEMGKTFKVETGGVYETNFGLLPESSISGIVVDESGTPISGAVVLCLRPLDRMSHPTEVKTDENGRFIFNLPAGTETAELMATSEESLSELKKVFPVGEEAKLVMKAISYAKVTGRVVDDGGNAVEGAVVGWYGEQIEGIDYQAISDAEGRFQFDKVIPKENLSFGVSRKGFGTGSRQASLKAGDQVTLDDIVLPVAEASISGIVVDSTGKAVPRAEISATGYRQPTTENFITDESGRFTLKGLVEGWLDLEVRKNKRFSKARLRTGTKDNIVKLAEEPWESKQQKIVDFVGKPAPPLNAVVWLNSDPLPEKHPGKVRLISFVGMDRPLIFFSNTIPKLQEFREANPEKELEIILIHGAWPRKEVTEILTANYPNFNLPIAIEPEDGAMSEKLGVQSWLYVVIDRQNNVVFQSPSDFSGAKKKALSLLKTKK